MEAMSVLLSPDLLPTLHPTFEAHAFLAASRSFCAPISIKRVAPMEDTMSSSNGTCEREGWSAYSLNLATSAGVACFAMSLVERKADISLSKRCRSMSSKCAPYFFWITLETVSSSVGSRSMSSSSGSIPRSLSSLSTALSLSCLALSSWRCFLSRIKSVLLLPRTWISCLVSGFFSSFLVSFLGSSLDSSSLDSPLSESLSDSLSPSDH